MIRRQLSARRQNAIGNTTLDATNFYATRLNSTRRCRTRSATPYAALHDLTLDCVISIPALRTNATNAPTSEPENHHPLKQAKRTQTLRSTSFRPPVRGVFREQGDNAVSLGHLCDGNLLDRRNYRERWLNGISKTARRQAFGAV